MNKTVEQWLQELPEPFREQALSNMEPGAAEEEVEYMSEAIHHGFRWRDTDEGWDYWDKIHQHYIRMELDHYISQSDSSPLSP